MLDLTLKELKENIYEEVNKILSTSGYKGNRNKMQFLKKTKDQEVLIEFDFNNYQPIDFQFIFGVAIRYPQLIDQMKKFYQIVEPQRPPQWNIFLTERDFVESLEQASSMSKKTYYNSVTSKKQAKQVIDKSLERLLKKALVLANKIPNKEYYREFISNNYFYLNEDLNIDLIVSALLVCMMQSKNDYEKVKSHIENFLVEEKGKGNYHDNEIFYLKKLEEYSKIF